MKNINIHHRISRITNLQTPPYKNSKENPTKHNFSYDRNDSSHENIKNRNREQTHQNGYQTNSQTHTHPPQYTPVMRLNKLNWTRIYDRRSVNVVRRSDTYKSQVCLSISRAIVNALPYHGLRADWQKEIIVKSLFTNIPTSPTTPQDEPGGGDPMRGCVHKSRGVVRWEFYLAVSRPNIIYFSDARLLYLLVGLGVVCVFLGWGGGLIFSALMGVRKWDWGDMRLDFRIRGLLSRFWNVCILMMLKSLLGGFHWKLCLIH